MAKQVEVKHKKRSLPSGFLSHPTAHHVSILGISKPHPLAEIFGQS